MPLDRTSYRSSKAPVAVRFGPFELDQERFQLTRNGLPLDLPRIAMEVLLLMAQRPGALISRAEMVEAIWPGMDPNDKVQGVNTAINRIRGALRDDPAKPKYVETVTGKGYRFIAQLEPLPKPQAVDDAREAAVVSASMPDAPATISMFPALAAEEVGRSGVRSRLVVAATLLAVCACVLIWKLFSHSHSRVLTASAFSLTTQLR